MSNLSHRVYSIKESATSSMSAKAQELKAKGIEIIGLSQGQPDFQTPEYICRAAKDAIDSGKYFSYPPTGGYLELREAIAFKYNRENNVPYKTENIVVSNGAKQALSNTFLAILNPTDEVIILAPYWVSYFAQVKIADGKPVLVKGKSQNGFKIEMSQIEAAITKRTKAIVFSSPCNPTGVFYSKKELEELAKIVSHYPNLFVIADEIYEHINYTSERVSFASLPKMFDRTITINGFGKCYAMTGWRIGYLAAPARIAKQVVKMQGHLSSSNCSIAQRAALAAVRGGLDSVNEMVEAYKERRDIVYPLLKGISNVKIKLPSGTFYFFPDLSEYYGLMHNGRQINNSIDMCDYLLETAHVALVPGAAFGDDACVRLSYAAPISDLIEASNRIKEALSNLIMQPSDGILTI